MATDYVMAALSNNSYQSPNLIILGPEWQIYEEFSPHNEDEGYFGVAYHNIITNEVIVAHRGTDQLPGADADDDLYIAIDLRDEGSSLAMPHPSEGLDAVMA